MRTATALAALVTVSLTPLTLPSAPVSAATAKYGDDFNGDGYRDYASYDESPKLGGGILVTFGTAQGPGTTTQHVDQSSPGVYGTDEADDMFGEVRAAADLDGDGYGDLAVAARGEDVDGRKDQGAVTVLWGGKNGLSGGTALANKGPKQSYDYMGGDLATGDFTGDGKQDLAVVNNGKTYIYRGGFTRSGTTGSVTTLDKSAFDSTALIAGKVNGDSRTDLVIIGDVATGSYIASDAWFVKGGSTLTSGKTLRLESQSGSGGSADRGGDGVIADFNKDGYGDIAIGTALYSGYQGRVSLWYGSSTGPGTSSRLTQATSGVAGSPEAGDSFGSSLSAGDVNGDGYQDLAVGVYGEKIDDKEYAGGVHVFKGRAGGISGTGSQWFARNSPGVPGALASDDGIEQACAPARHEPRRHGGPVLHGPGRLLRLPGSPSGITTTGATPANDVPIEGFLQ